MTEASAATSGLLFSVVVGRHRAAVQQPTLWQQKSYSKPKLYTVSAIQANDKEPPGFRGAG